MKIYLASKSPRRKELLEQMELDFEILEIDTPEILIPGEPASVYSKRIVKEKLNAAWDKILKENFQPRPVICADTEVILDGIILGKPRDRDDAFQMLNHYSGRTHEVITSVGLKYYDYLKIEISRTLVSFSHIPVEAIHHYLATDNYKDKSGGYGIQSYIGQFISRIQGCFYSVMGLPLHVTRTLLDDFKVTSLKK